MSEEQKPDKVVEGISFIKYKHTFAKPAKEVAPEIKTKLKAEVKRVYNQTYYAKNKESVLQYHAKLYAEKLGKTVECPNCGRSVTQQRLAKHQKTKLCKKFTK